MPAEGTRLRLSRIGEHIFATSCLISSLLIKFVLLAQLFILSLQILLISIIDIHIDIDVDIVIFVCIAVRMTLFRNIVQYTQWHVHRDVEWTYLITAALLSGRLWLEEILHAVEVDVALEVVGRVGRERRW